MAEEEGMTDMTEVVVVGMAGRLNASPHAVKLNNAKGTLWCLHASSQIIAMHCK